jgi:hypothetical protein
MDSRGFFCVSATLRPRPESLIDHDAMPGSNAATGRQRCSLRACGGKNSCDRRTEGRSGIPAVMLDRCTGHAPFRALPYRTRCSFSFPSQLVFSRREAIRTRHVYDHPLREFRKQSSCGTVVHDRHQGPRLAAPGDLFSSSILYVLCWSPGGHDVGG